MAMMRKQKPLRELLRECDVERGQGLRGVFVRLDAKERNLLKTAAAEARTSQMGILRMGLRLAAQAISTLQDDEYAEGRADAATS